MVMKVRNVSGETRWVHAHLDSPPVQVEDQGVIEVPDEAADLLDQRDGTHWVLAEGKRPARKTTPAQEG